jgi:pilus assembly protein CpaF
VNKDQSTTLQSLYAIVEEELRPTKPLIGYEKNKRDEIEKHRKTEQQYRLSATDGCEESRDFVLNRIYGILADMKDIINPSCIDGIITQYHIDYFHNLYTGLVINLVKTPIDREIERYFKKYSILHEDNFEKKLRKLAQIIYQELYGYNILDELVFESEFNEVACNRYDYIWIQYKGIKRRIPNPDFKFADEDIYRRVIENRITAAARVEMNAGEPFINCTLKNGFRITAIRPPLSRYYVVNVRLFTYRDTAAEQRSRFMAEKMMTMVKILAGKGRRNIAIIGEQGSGKTTAADELIIKNLDDNLSIGLAEYTHELNISGNHPVKNVVELQYGKEFQPSDTTEMFFRFNRDIMIYGEVRSPAEAFEMIKAMLRQARGSLFTFHSSSVRRMIHDLRQLLMQTGYYTDYREAQFDVADAVDIVIQISLDRVTGARYVSRISEVAAGEQDMSFFIHDLFSYDREKKKYLVNMDGLSSDLLHSCLEYEMTAGDIVKLSELFNILSEEKQIFEYMQEGG